MKALSVRQPYAWAIVNGWKPVENRSWPTSFRGKTLIHAGKAEMRDDVDDVLRQVVRQTGEQYAKIVERYRLEALRGGIVGWATIVDCVTDMDNPWFRGPYGFVLRDASPMAFIPCVGALGFFNVPPTVAAWVCA